MLVHVMPFNRRNSDVALQVLGYVPDGYILCTLDQSHATIWVDGHAFFSFYVSFTHYGDLDES